MSFTERLLEAGIFFFSVYLAFIAIVLAFFLAKIVYDILKLRVKLREHRKIRDSMRYDAFNVEGEVLSFTTKKLGRMDTQYNVNIVYTVGTIRYYKEIVLHNRGSLRVGQKIILLCDNDDPSNAVLQNGGEENAIKDMLFALVIEVGIFLYALWGVFDSIKEVLNYSGEI